jgi:hypothetical protein
MKIHATKYSGQLLELMLGAEQRLQRVEQEVWRAELRVQIFSPSFKRYNLQMPTTPHPPQ